LPDQADLIELNEIFLKACDPELRQRYQAAEEMRAEIELLQTGQSVKRARTVERRRGMGKKAGLAFIALALVAASVAFLLHQFKRSEFAGDGPPSKDEDANRICATAMNIVRGDRYEEFAKAYTNFHRALERDPHFARPYVGLLELRLREAVPSLGAASPEEMRTIAGKLKELAPNLAATYCAQAIVNWFEWNFPQAKRFVLQAIKADPNYELGHTWYGYMLCLWGYPVESRRQYEISQQLAPSKVTVYRGLGRSYYMEHRYTTAIELLKTAL